MGRHSAPEPGAAEAPTVRLVTVPADLSKPAQLTTQEVLVSTSTDETASAGQAPPDPTAPGLTSSSTSPGLLSTQPVALTSIVQGVLAAAVACGWVVLDSATAATVASAVAGLIWLVLTLFARSKVTPTAAPRNEQGQPLAPEPGASA